MSKISMEVKSQYKGVWFSRHISASLSDPTESLAKAIDQMKAEFEKFIVRRDKEAAKKEKKTASYKADAKLVVEILDATWKRTTEDGHQIGWNRDSAPSNQSRVRYYRTEHKFSVGAYSSLMPDNAMRRLPYYAAFCKIIKNGDISEKARRYGLAFIAKRAKKERSLQQVKKLMEALSPLIVSQEMLSKVNFHYSTCDDHADGWALVNKKGKLDGEQECAIVKIEKFTLQLTLAIGTLAQWKTHKACKPGDLIVRLAKVPFLQKFMANPEFDPNPE